VSELRDDLADVRLDLHTMEQKLAAHEPDMAFLVRSSLSFLSCSFLHVLQDRLGDPRTATLLRREFDDRFKHNLPLFTLDGMYHVAEAAGISQLAELCISHFHATVRVFSPSFSPTFFNADNFLGSIAEPVIAEVQASRLHDRARLLFNVPDRAGPVEGN
jgi:hypothetical protein